ncbi:MAG TPA: hypothetical protein VN848_00905 [Gemmatimonadales bacterium]|nr:hypothetical protein [Gemmatimonadales bacterium]
MTKLLAFLVATGGGWIGWALGARVGIMTAFILSMVGTSVGILGGRPRGRPQLGRPEGGPASKSRG